MGSALSRCASTSRNSGAAASGVARADMGQRILDRQPNWLIPPARWRPQTCTHQPVRYRTPTPYPKEDRKRLDEDAQPGGTVHVPEKAVVVETPVASHHEVVANPPRKQHKPATRPPKPLLQKPPAVMTITWEVSPRLNRFERGAA